MYSHDRKMKVQTRILKELLDLGREIGISELEKNTEFSKIQIYEALRNLDRRRLIEKRREIGVAGYKSPPTGKIYVKIKENNIKRIRKVIQNDRRD